MKDFAFCGLVGIEDPPKAGVQDAISKVFAAGAVTIMVTGDHPSTAIALISINKKRFFHICFIVFFIFFRFLTLF